MRLHNLTTPTYTTRFGDVCDNETHEVLGWSPLFVREGVFGDDTLSWIFAQCEFRGYELSEDKRELLAAIHS